LREYASVPVRANVAAGPLTVHSLVQVPLHVLELGKGIALDS
jgi:hypothetical protein